MDSECFVAPGFDQVKQSFKNNLDRGLEKGGCFAVYYKGNLVVNLWGGVADPATNTRWKKDTLSVFFSATKGITAITIAHLVDRAVLDYDEKISSYWPEFAQNGKEDITLGQFLTHSAGLVNLDGEWRLWEVLDDWPVLEKRMTQQKPYWKRGSEFGYHPLTFGLYLDAIIRRVDSKRRSFVGILQRRNRKTFRQEIKQNMTDPECFVATGFEKVFDTFKQNLANGLEKGGSFAAYYKGELVVNIWGGVTDTDKKTPWKKDTLSVFFSSTKAISAIVIAHLVDRGLLKYEETISKYWPEFGQNGKENVTLGQYISFGAGLVNLDGEWYLKEVIEDYSMLEKRMAEQEPYWTPGTEFGYHAITFALYLDAIIRRADPQKRSLAEYFNDEFAKPLDLDFYIGLPEELFERATFLVNLKDHYDPDRFFEEAFKGAKKEYLERSQRCRAPLDMQNINEEMNKKEGRKLPIGSSHGSGTAKSVAKLYGILANGGHYKGKQVLSQEVIKTLEEPVVTGVDQMLGIRKQNGMGTWLMPVIADNNFEKQYNLFGHPGAGGQYGYADAWCKLGVAYTSNFLNVYFEDFENFIDERFNTLLVSTYDCIEATDGVHRRVLATYGQYLRLREEERKNKD